MKFLVYDLGEALSLPESKIGYLSTRHNRRCLPDAHFIWRGTLPYPIQGMPMQMLAAHGPCARDGDGGPPIGLTREIAYLPAGGFERIHWTQGKGRLQRADIPPGAAVGRCALTTDLVAHEHARGERLEQWLEVGDARRDDADTLNELGRKDP